jgi:hypothetical protein
VSNGALLCAVALLMASVVGCSFEPQVASLTLVIPRPASADLVRAATSRGWQEGESCRFWLLGIPFGLPQLDEAMEKALVPVHGILMRDVSVRSVHPTYWLFGWHCYRVRGEVLG